MRGVWEGVGTWRGLLERLLGHLLLPEPEPETTPTPDVAQPPTHPHLLLLTPTPVAGSLLAWDATVTRTSPQPSAPSPQALPHLPHLQMKSLDLILAEILCLKEIFYGTPWLESKVVLGGWEGGAESPWLPAGLPAAPFSPSCLQPRRAAPQNLSWQDRHL